MLIYCEGKEKPPDPGLRYLKKLLSKRLDIYRGGQEHSQLFSLEFWRSKFRRPSIFLEKTHTWNFWKWPKIDIWGRKIVFRGGIWLFLDQSSTLDLKHSKVIFCTFFHINIVKNGWFSPQKVSSFFWIFDDFFTTVFRRKIPNLKKSENLGKSIFFKVTKIGQKWSKTMKYGL